MGIEDAEETPRLAYRLGTIKRSDSGELPTTVSKFELDDEFGSAGRAGVTMGESCGEI